jgi:chromosome partitioning protein
MKKKIIQFVNQKGGAGKTTSAINVASGLATRGYKTLLIDFDPQENSTYVLYRKHLDPHGSKTITSSIDIEGVRELGLPDSAFEFFTKLNKERDVTYSLYGVLVEGVPITNTILKTPFNNLEFIPSHIRLAEFDLAVASAVDSRAERMKNALKPVLDKYDFIIVDTPPSLSLLAFNAFASVDALIVPVSGSFFGLTGLNQLMESAIRIRRTGMNPNLRVLGILCTMTDRTSISRDVENLLRNHFEDKVFKTTIPKNISLEEAHSRRTHIFDYSPSSKGALAYKALIDEILEL